MMSYRGFGYPDYRYSAPENQQATPYSLGRNNIADPPAAPNPILHHNDADRNYQQVPGWQGQNLPNPQGSSLPSRNNNWIANSSNPPNQYQSSYPQRQMRNQPVQGLNQNAGQQQFRPPQFDSQPSRSAVPNTATYSNSILNNAAPQSTAQMLNGGSYYQSNPPSQTPTTSVSSIALDYQSSTMEPFHRPASSQRERDAAASAMTALSTSIPSRSLPQGQQQQYSTSTHTDVSPPLNNTAQTVGHRNPTHNYSIAQPNVSASQVASQNMNQYSTRSPSLQSRSNATAYSGRSSHSPSMVTARQRGSPQVQNQSPNMPASAPRMAVNPDPPQQPQQPQPPPRLQPSPVPSPTTSVSQQQTQNPEPAQAPSSQIDITPPAATVNTTSSSRYSGANMQSYQSTSSLPNFVDPAQIYNPYHLEMQAAMERKMQEEEEETRRRQNAEAEAARLQEEEERRRLEERVRAEEEVRKHLESMGQASNNAHSVPRQSVGNYDNRSSRTDGDTEGGVPEAGAPADTPAPAQQPESTSKRKPQQKTQRKPRRKSEKTAQQSTGQAAPNKRSRKRKSANDAISASQPLANTEGHATDGKEGEPENDMAGEFQGMIQKMNKLKTQNPSLFAKLCDDLQLQNDPKLLGVAEGSNTAAASQPTSDNATLQQAAQAQGQLPDLGKFPAARRKHKDIAKPSSVPAMPESPAQEKGPGATVDLTGEEGTDWGKFPAARRRIRSDKGQPRVRSRVSAEGEAEVPRDAASQEQSNQAVQATEQEEDLSTPDKIGRSTEKQDATSQPAEATRQQKCSGSSSKPYNIWPSARRHALAEAACDYINGVSKNRESGRTCEPSVILDLIDQNPTYIEICELIESRGYSLNRVHFAKHLLKQVPDLTNSGAGGGSSDNQAQAPTTTTPNSAPSQSQPQVAPPPSPSGGSLATPSQPGIAPPVSAANSSAVPPPVFHSPPAHHTSHRISLDDGPSVAHRVPPTNGNPVKFLPARVAPPVPQTGRGLARQTSRLFTQSQSALGSTYKPGYKLDPRLRVPAPPVHKPSPGSKEALARKRNFSELVDLTQSLSDEEDSGPASKSPRVETSAERADVHQPPPESQTAQSSVQEAPQPTDLSRFKADTSPTGKQEALRRRNDLVKPINKAQAVRKSYYDPRTIARDVLIASGRHPTERPLNNHLTKLREKFTFVDNNSNLETFRWELVDPGGPPRPEVAPEPLMTKPPELPKLHNQQARDSDASDDQPSTSQPSQKSRPQPSSLRISHTVDDNFSSPEPMRPTEHKSAGESSSHPTPRRRGRPPGSKNKATLVALAQTQRPQVVVPAKTLSKHRVYKCQWAHCDAKLHSLSVLRKHVLRVHLPDSTVCQWMGCTTAGRGAGTQVSSGTFDAEELRQHLESHHLSELAWEKGEGPSPMPSDRLNRDLHNCLEDSKGRTVVPQASTRGAPPTLILPAAYASIRSFNKMRGNESDRAKAQEVVRALEAKQAMVGVGVNRGGCTLMNSTRQQTVGAFERVFEVVPEDS